MTVFRLTATLLGCLALVPVASRAEERPDFSGVWVLNESLSDDPMVKIQEQMRAGQLARSDQPGQGASGFRGGFSGFEGSGGGRGAGDSPGGAPPDPTAMARRMEELNAAAKTLVIEHDEPVLRLRYADGRERVLQADGKKHIRESGFGDLETKTKWKGKDRLVVKATTDRDHKIAEIFQLSPGRTRLLVTVDVHTERDILRLERVYERREEPSSAD